MSEQVLSWQSLRRRLRIRLRSLIVLVLFTGCVFAYIVYILRSAERQRVAVAAIGNAQGSVGYDREFLTGQIFEKGRFAAPKWMARRIGVDYCANAVTVSLPDSATDEDLVHVGQLDSLEVLAERSAPQLTGAGLSHLRGLSALRMLILPNTKLNDAGLAHVSGMTGLRYLEISHTQVTDVGLVHLHGLTKLESLKLEGTPITDAGLAHVKDLRGLRWLVLSGTNITDRGLASIEALSRLEYLDVTKTAVTSAGVERLRQALPRLIIRQ